MYLSSSLPLICLLGPPPAAAFFSSPTLLSSLSLICIYTIRLKCYTRSHKCTTVHDVVSVKLFISFRRMLFRLPSSSWWFSGLGVLFLSFLKASVPFFWTSLNEATTVFILGLRRFHRMSLTFLWGYASKFNPNSQRGFRTITGISRGGELLKVF